MSEQSEQLSTVTQNNPADGVENVHVVDSTMTNTDVTIGESDMSVQDSTTTNTEEAVEDNKDIVISDATLTNVVIQEPASKIPMYVAAGVAVVAIGASVYMASRDTANARFGAPSMANLAEALRKIVAMVCSRFPGVSVCSKFL